MMEGLIIVQGTESDYLPTGLFRRVTKVQMDDETKEFFAQKECSRVGLVVQIADDLENDSWVSSVLSKVLSFDEACALLGYLGHEDVWLDFPHCLIFVGAVEVDGDTKILTVEKVQRNFPFTVKLDLMSLDQEWEIFDQIFPEIFHISQVPKGYCF